MTKVINNTITSLVFFMLLLTEVMPPAPQDIFDISILMVIAAVVISLVFIFLLKAKMKINFYGTNSFLTFFFMFYILYLLISAIFGMIESTSPISLIRSIAPYIIFIPGTFLICLKEYKCNIHTLALLLVFCGLLQAINCIFLFVSANIHSTTTFDVLINRITLLDARCTIPFILASAIIPLYYFFNTEMRRRQSYRILSLIAIVISVIGAMATATRSLILAMLLGLVLYLVLRGFYEKKQNVVVKPRTLKRFVFFCLILVIIFFTITYSETINLAFQAFFSRVNPDNSLDYSTGRFGDEWLPALTLWWHSNPLKIIFGIGSGVIFYTASGESRTYIHNILIYSLVYGGIFGLLSVLGLYFSTFISLFRKAKVTHDPLYISLCSFLGGIFFYVQLFAVHKLFSYNLILFILIGVAFRATSFYLGKNIKA